MIYDQTAKNEALLKEGTADILLNGTYPEKEYLYTGIDIKMKYNL